MTRLAIAGAGWAGRVHTLAASAVSGATVPLIATRSVGSAEVLASEIGARPVTADQLPGSAEAVVVATPPPDHAALAVRLLSAGTAVLIEKPLAATLTEADAIVAAAEATGAAACYAENLLFAPALDVAVNRRVALGAIDHLEVRMAQPMPTWGHFAEPLTAGGVLFDLGVHALAVLLVLARDDEPVALRARLGSSRDDGADDVGRVEVRFASDLIASIDVSWNSDVIEWSAEASSPTGVVRVDFQPDVTVEVNGTSVPVPHVDSEIDARISTSATTPSSRGSARSSLGAVAACVLPASAGRCSRWCAPHMSRRAATATRCCCPTTALATSPRSNSGAGSPSPPPRRSALQNDRFAD